MTSTPSAAEPAPGPADSQGLRTPSRRDSFVALLAHEIRNPLAPIRSGLALLRTGRLDEQSRSGTIAMMERQLSHLVRLVDDLLASVSVGTNDVPMNADRVRLADVLSAAVESVHPAVSSKEQRLDLIGAEVGMMVDVDPKRLAQAFSNLLNSSSKNTPWHGRLRVEVSTMSNVAVLRFSDTGTRIPEDQLADVFDLFAPSSIAIGEGLGIGLALVRALVEMNGGTIEAVERPGGDGTEFVVTIPVAAARSDPDIAPPRTPSATEQWRSRRVLVVDDNRDAAQTLGALMELDGHTIRLAHDGPGAVAEACEFRPEVILMDIGLPGFNGLVATQEIRRKQLEPRPMIVALTGWGSAADRKATMGAGCDLHLVKPMDYSEIVQALALQPRSLKDAP